MRALIRHDQERAEVEGFERLKAALFTASTAPESAYGLLDSNTVIARNARHRSRDGETRSGSMDNAEIGAQ